jgi:SAM-dependent methyltransferase
MHPRLFPIAVGLVSFATIAVELLLTRIYSVTLYYHFAFMVISLAMLGLAVSGVGISLLPRVFDTKRTGLLASVFGLLFAVAAVYALKSAVQNPIRLYQWREDVGKLGTLYVSAGLAFLFSGFALSLAIAGAGKRIGTVYAYDLGGAAIGCMCVIPATSMLGAPGAILVAAAAGAVGASLFALSMPDRSRPAVRALAALGLVAAAVLGVAGVQENSARRFGVARNPTKFLGDREVLFERWNSFSQITVGVSGEPDYHWIFIDADAATRLWSGSIAADGWRAPLRIPEVRVAALAYALRHDGTALIIGPGGGTDVISALRAGAPRVIGVEVNPIIVNNVVRGQFAQWSGDLYRNPRVQVVVDEGRSFVRRAPEQFATIQATLVDTWAASSSGAFSCSENNIYTVEAVEEFLGHLRPGGLVAITRWYAPNSPKEFLRLLALAREALERRGVTPGDVRKHVVIAADGALRTVMLLNNRPFSDDDLALVERRAAEDGLQVLFLAGNPRPSEDAFLAGFLRAPSARDFLARLDYDATPTVDDRPFFFYNLRTADLLGLLKTVGAVPLNNLGIFVLLFLLVASTVFTLALVILPLLIFQRAALRERRTEKLRVLGYFLGIGLGFILVEMGFMQKFVLFLGHPTYALAVVLATLLGASGLGSALSERVCDRFGEQGATRRIAGALAGVLGVYALVLTPIFHTLLGLPLTVRIVIAAILVAAPGLLMGMLLPTGVRVANRMGSSIVAWGWGLNGGASVIGSVLAILLAMNAGFTVSLALGIVVYGLSAFVLPKTPEEAPPTEPAAPAAEAPPVAA